MTPSLSLSLSLSLSISLSLSPSLPLPPYFLFAPPTPHTTPPHHLLPSSTQELLVGEKEQILTEMRAMKKQLLVMDIKKKEAEEKEAKWFEALKRERFTRKAADLVSASGRTRVAWMKCLFAPLR